MNRVVIVGGGGFVKCIINYIENNKDFEIIGYTDICDNGSILDIPYLGKDEDVLPKLKNEGVEYAVIGIGNRLNDSNLKQKVTEKVLSLGFKIPTIYGKHTTIHRGAIIEDGVVIRDGAIIQAGSIIKAHSMIGDNVFIAHDTVVESYAHVVAGSNVGRDCIIGKGSMVGNGTTVLNGVKIASNVLIGAKSLVNRDCLEEGETYFGIPAKKRVK